MGLLLALEPVHGIATSQWSAAQTLLGQPAGNGAASEAQARLMHSQTSFNQASSVGATSEEKAVEASLASAMQAPMHVGKPEMTVSEEQALACLPDINACPRGWTLQGTICTSTSYQGTCKPSVSLFEMTTEEKMTFARYCKVEFDCQSECPADLTSACPSLWTQIGKELCEAPSNYVGSCASRVDTHGMTSEDKISFGQKCGARWPCAPPAEHIYSEVCPQGWTLSAGQTCTAPAAYQGPCGSSADMSGMSTSDKQSFEATCGVSWPVSQARCEKNYAAQCPSGWRERTIGGHSECIAPPQYEGCSAVQSFAHMSPIDKQRWERNCAAAFPCKGA